MRLRDIFVNHSGDYQLRVSVRERKEKIHLRAYNVLSFDFQKITSIFMDKKADLREVR